MAAVSYDTALSHGGNGGIQALAPEICLPRACGAYIPGAGLFCAGRMDMVLGGASYGAGVLLHFPQKRQTAC